MHILNKALIGTVLTLTAASSFAAAITSTNATRPVGGLTIGNTSDASTPCWAGGPANCQLQTLLNYFEPGKFNAATDQVNQAMFALPGAVVGATVPLLLVEITAFERTHSLGMFSDADGDSATAGDRSMVEVFNAAATGANNGGPTLTSLLFNFVAGTVSVNGGAAQLINGKNFGFYMTSGNGTFYSSDVMNPSGGTQFVAYRDTNANRWYLGFEDILRNATCTATGSFGGDCDHNDMLFSIESIVPAPEPGTLALLGLGLLGFGVTRRRLAK